MIKLLGKWLFELDVKDVVRMINYIFRLAKNLTFFFISRFKAYFFILKFSINENKILLIDEVTHLKNVILGEKNFIGSRVSFLSHNGGVISIGNNCRIEKYCILEALSGDISFGNYSTLNPFSIIRSYGDVKIGDGVRIGPSVQIMAMNHKYDNANEFIYEQGICGVGIEIGDNVWVGSNVVILDGVTIGNNCIIGASSVVTRNVPSNSIVAGNPAVFKKKLYFNVEISNVDC